MYLVMLSLTANTLNSIKWYATYIEPRDNNTPTVKPESLVNQTIIIVSGDSKLYHNLLFCLDSYFSGCIKSAY